MRGEGRSRSVGGKPSPVSPTSMEAAVILPTPPGYEALSEGSLPVYLREIGPVAERLGGSPDDWTVREVGDGNLNLVFIVRGKRGACCVKQSLP